jgi:type I site-specific restriction endonuclease
VRERERDKEMVRIKWFDGDDNVSSVRLTLEHASTKVKDELTLDILKSVHWFDGKEEEMSWKTDETAGERERREREERELKGDLKIEQTTETRRTAAAFHALDGKSARAQPSSGTPEVLVVSPSVGLPLSLFHHRKLSSFSRLTGPEVIRLVSRMSS